MRTKAEGGHVDDGEEEEMVECKVEEECEACAAERMDGCDQVVE